MTRSEKAKVVIVGAGSAGISIGARLLRGDPDLQDDVLFIDPSEDHYYQPLWTLVGGGQAKLEDTHRKQKNLMPEGSRWFQDAVSSFDPDHNTLKTDNGTTVGYEFLVVTGGIDIKWHWVEGLTDTIGQNGVCSNYSPDYVESTWEFVKNMKGGNAIFTQPSTPVKCAGAPQKIMYLADDMFQKNGVDDKTEVQFYSGTGSIFGVKKYADTLQKVIDRKGIDTHFQMDLAAIDGPGKQATFKHVETGETVIQDFDMIHVTPPMGAPGFIAKSPLANEEGWVDVDAHTLQHNTYANVFSAGDCASLPTSKTGAAIRQQAPVLAENLLAIMHHESAAKAYDGYTSCPLVTGVNRLVMAEFNYDKEPQESFPVDQGKERMSMYLVKKNLLPIMYWNGMLKGTM